MVSSLPNELILDILELAANASPGFALTLCLLSSTTARSIRPILYRKVRLVLLHDTQVPSPVVPSPGPCSTPRTSATYTRTLWVLYTSRSTAFYAAMEPVATTCERTWRSWRARPDGCWTGCTRTKAGEAHWRDSHISSVFAYSTRMRYRFPKSFLRL